MDVGRVAAVVFEFLPAGMGMCFFGPPPYLTATSCSLEHSTSCHLPHPVHQTSRSVSTYLGKVGVVLPPQAQTSRVEPYVGEGKRLALDGVDSRGSDQGKNMNPIRPGSAVLFPPPHLFQGRAQMDEGDGLWYAFYV